MTSLQDSEILTRVGPGTPMGNLMRHYWLPALKSSELIADGDPVRFLLLGEKLIAFRDTSGRVGVMDHRCPHRCASLFLGRNEENGIRCIYHGWKYDVDGNCVDQPNLPPSKTFMDKVHAKAYRARERNGIVYVYMGNAAERAGSARHRRDPYPRRGCRHHLHRAQLQLAAGARRRYRHLASELPAFRLDGAERVRPDRSEPLRRAASRSRLQDGRHRARHDLRRLSPGRCRQHLLARRAFPLPVLDARAVHPVRALPHRPRLGAARRHAYDVHHDRSQGGQRLDRDRRSRCCRTRPIGSAAGARRRIRPTTISSTAPCSANRASPASPTSISRTRRSPKAWATSPTMASRISPSAIA